MGDPGSIPGSWRSPGEGRGYPLQCSWASLVAQLVKNLSAMLETWIRISGLGRSPGEGKGYPLQYSGLQNSMDCIAHGVTKSWIRLNNFHRHHSYYFGLPRWLSGKEFACQCRRHRFSLWVRKTPWRRKWQPTPVLLPGKSFRHRSLAGYSPWRWKRVRHSWAGAPIILAP